MKHTKNKHLKSLIIMFILSSAFLYGCNKENSSIKFSNTIDELLRKLDTVESEVDYKDYLELTLNEPEVLPNAPCPNPEKNLVLEKVIIKNITDSPLKIKCRAFLTRELADTFDITMRSFAPGAEIVELEPHQEMILNADFGFKKAELMTEKEKNIYNKDSQIIYLELSIDGKYCCVKLEV